MARIAVGGFQHESNSFVAHRADFAYFESHRDRPPLVRGPDVLQWLRGGSFGLSGFMQHAQPRHDLVPLVWASGGAGGTVTPDAYERIVGEMMGRLSLSMPVDAVYLDLHGAMASVDYPDADGESVRRVRAVVGDKIPIVVSLDYHANLSPELVRHSDGVTSFRTYPHVDRPQTGERAARMIDHLLRTGRPAGRALRKPPFILPSQLQCTLVEPSKSIVAGSLAAEGEVVSLSYLAGFASADVEWCGPAIVAHASTQELADKVANSMYEFVLARESDFQMRFWTAADAVQEAMALSRSANRPVILADTQDNPGGGGSADTTGILIELIKADAPRAVVGFFCDPAAAAAAHAAGEGRTIHIALGGKFGPAGVEPLVREFIVTQLGSGKFRTTGSVTGGGDVDLGPMALLTVNGVSVVVTSKRMQAFDPAPFEHLKVDVTKQRILVLKSTCHFRADFAPLASHVLVVLAPGYCSANLPERKFTRLRSGVRLGPNGPTYSRPLQSGTASDQG